MKKILTLLLITFVLSGCGVSAESSSNSDIVKSTVSIAYNGDTKQIEVSSVILHANDAYYGIEVNDAVNYCNLNNYFTTAKGLTIALLENAEPGINEEDEYTSVQELEPGLCLMIKGEKSLVEETFKRIYKTNAEVYQMFAHDINPDWTKEVVITSDVVSFSNGEDTTYIYQNPGSLSPGCYKGRIEPTVFYKQLRGIDIPITYLEDMKDDSVRGKYEIGNSYTGDGELVSTNAIYTSNVYIPYDFDKRNNLLINNYTPYSAYDLSDVTYKGQQVQATNVFNYIILANNDYNVLSLFNNINNRYTNVLTIQNITNVIPSYNLDIKNYNLSEYKNIAKNVINSDNRYHFGIVKENEGTKTADEYYIDAPQYKIDTKNIVAMDNMLGKIVLPTMASQEPIYPHGYKYNTSNYAAELSTIETVRSLSDHGAYGILIRNGTEIGNNHFYLHESMLEGDYAYELRNDYALYIYKNIGTERKYAYLEGSSYIDEKGNRKCPGFYCFDGLNMIEQYRRLKRPDLITESCANTGVNSLYQQYELVSHIQY